MASAQNKQKRLIYIGFAVGILMMLLVGAFAYQSNANFAASAKRVEESQRVLTTLQQLMRIVSRAESSQRGYIITGQNQYLEDYQAAPDLAAAEIAALRQLRADTESLARIEKVESLTADRLALMKRNVETRQRSGAEAAFDAVRTNEGHNLSTSLRAEIEALEAVELQNLTRYSAANDANKSKAQLLLPLGLALGLIAVVAAAVVVLRDNARRIKAEADLVQASAVQKAILGATDLSVISVDLDGKVVLFNAAAQKMLGYKPTDVVGKLTLPEFHDKTEVEDRAKKAGVPSGFQVFTKPALAKGIYQEEWTYVRKDGTRLPVSLAVSPLKDEAGTVIGFVGIAADQSKTVEDRAQLDSYVRQIEEAREDLADKNRLLEEFAEELKASRDEALDATKTKSEFLANMSHEIRTPLNGVLGTTHLLLNTELNDKQRSYVQLIHRSAESLLGILNDILDLSKMEAGKMSLEAEPFDLRQTLEDVCEQFAPVAHQKGLDLNLVFGSHDPDQLIGDSGRIRQVATNLVANAIKFTEKGEVDLQVETVREDSGSIQYRISVIDTGIGIPQDKLDSIFESFTQADGNTARRFGGTGLGLAISRQLIELMHGQIGVDSTHGKGSQFWFEVTFEKQQVAPSDADKRDLGGISVLVAEDNETNLAAITEQLESWNCKVTAATTGEQATDLIGKQSFDCAVVDMLLPDRDGLEVARAVRKSKRTRDLPMVLISSAHVIPNETESAGLYQSTLTKPARAAMLYEAVARAVKMGVTVAEPATQKTTQQTLADARVLVVEDNPINQLVVTEMLKSWGCTVVAVDNGRKAVDRLTVDRFDIVLMDVQMPEMDGLEATRTIRAREKGTERHVPIVAMTANAMKGDEERCLESGMDAYLSKPIQPKLLAETMGRYAGHEVTIEPETKAVHAEKLPAFDIEQLNQTTSTNPELQQRVLERYLETLAPNTAKLDDAVKLLDREQVRALAHSLKGSSWTVGALAMADIYRRLETGADSLSGGAMEDLMLEAEEAVVATRQQIQEYLRQTVNTT